MKMNMLSIKEGRMRRKQAIVAAAISAVAGVAMVAHAETFIVELDGPAFVFGGMTNMDIDLSVEVGDTVRWVWISGFHNVVNGFPGDPDEDTLFNSGPPTNDPATFFEYIFDEEGIFGYHCEVHEDIGMISFVTVNAVPAPGTILALAPVGMVLARRRR